MLALVIPGLAQAGSCVLNLGCPWQLPATSKVHLSAHASSELLPPGDTSTRGSGRMGRADTASGELCRDYQCPGEQRKLVRCGWALSAGLNLLSFRSTLCWQQPYIFPSSFPRWELLGLPLHHE